MNVVDELGAFIGAYRGKMPDTPDTAVAVFAYDASQIAHSFGRTNEAYGLQVRCRAKTPPEAYALAESAQTKLNRYVTEKYTVLQSTPILDIGEDDKGRREYTINFTVRRIR